MSTISFVQAVEEFWLALVRLPHRADQPGTQEQIVREFGSRQRPQMPMNSHDHGKPAVSTDRSNERTLTYEMADVPAIAPEIAAGRWLVVDDSPSDRRMMEEALVESGVAWDEIVSVGSIGAARRAALADDIAGILLDQSLPGASGPDSVSILSSMLPEVPLVVVTARPADSLVYAALVQRADEYVEKNNHTVELLDDVLARAQQRRDGQPQRLATRPSRALDKLASPAITVDGAGRIVATNAAWREAALAGGATLEFVGPGVNYLRVCDEAVKSHTDGAGDAAAGIRSVLSGAADAFHLEYPFTFGGEQTWWDLRVTPIGDSGNGALIAHVDITDVKRAELELSGCREPAGQVFDEDELFLLVDAQQRVVQLSRRMRQLTRLQPGDPAEVAPEAFLDPIEGEAINTAYQRVRATPHSAERVSVRVADRQGVRRQLDLSITNLLDDPAVRAIAVTGADVTRATARRVVARLRDRLLDLLPTVVTVVDDVGTIVYCSSRSEVMLGRSPSEVIGRSIGESNLLPIEPAHVEAIRIAAETSGQWEGDVDLRRKDGSTVPAHLILERIDDDEIGFHGTVGISFDVTERRKLEENLEFQAAHDSLTGLFNRQRFVQFLEQALVDADESGRRVAVFFVDLDEFKTVNDRIGHDAGDVLLAAVAARLRSVLPPECVAARFGGDEFVFYCPDLDDVGPAVENAQRLLDALERPIGSGAEAVVVSGSVGIALSGPGAQADELLRRSDIAMYAAKDAGKNRIEVFDDAVGHSKRRQREMVGELESALDNGELTVHFQPEMSLFDGHVSAFEALVRWDHPLRGQVPPNEFVPAAEVSGLIHRLGYTVLDQSCRAMRSWLDRGLGAGLIVAVNVSTRQLLDYDFPDVVERLVTEWGVPAHHLCLEVTESALIDADVAARALNRLDAIGVSIAIDDFGTGYSSLSRLSQYPLDFMKIDHSFVANLATEPASTVIVHMVVDLAHALGLQTIAEGIETNEQLALLADAGCDIGQGFVWSPAVTFDEATAMLRDQPFAEASPGGRRGAHRGVAIDFEPRRRAGSLPVTGQQCRS